MYTLFHISSRLSREIHRRVKIMPSIAGSRINVYSHRHSPLIIASYTSIITGQHCSSINGRHRAFAESFRLFNLACESHGSSK